jgi:hypothetical protein
MEPSKKDEVLSLPFVRWTGVYHPYYKISPELNNLRSVENKTRQYVKGYGWVEYTDPLYVSLPDLKSIGIYLLPDADAQKIALKLQKMGIEIKKVLGYPSNRIIVWTSLNNLNSIAKIPEVYYISPYYPKAFLNNTTRYVVQSDILTVAPDDWPNATADTVTSGSLPVWNHNIRGQGEIITIMDTGVDYYSCSFWDPEGDPPGPDHIVVYAYTDEGGNTRDTRTCGHGTHVSGTVAGDPSRGGATQVSDYSGNAYQGKIYMQDVGYEFGNSCPLNFTNFYNSAQRARNTYGSYLHSNSWGYTSGFGNYQYESIDIDVFTFLYKDFLFIVSAGNNGPGSNTVGMPSTAKNCLSVGSTYRQSYDYDADYISEFSSRGPTDDSRRKPDLTAPGGYDPPGGGVNPGNNWRAYILSSYPGQTWGSFSCSFSGMVGTSMAAPAVTAAAALVRQYYREGWFVNGTYNPSQGIMPSGALVKATLLLSTVDMTGVSGYPNYTEGWGRVLLDNALYFSGDTRELEFDDNTTGLTTGQYVDYPLTVGSSAEPLKIVLVWHDTAGAANANPTLVNDLDLIVTAPNSNIYYGNYFSGGQSAPGGSPDRRNNVEVVLLNTPPTGTYNIRVRAYNVGTGSPQPYAITIAGRSLTLGVHEAYTDIDAEILSSGIKLKWNSFPDISYYEIYKKESNHRAYKFLSLVETSSFTDKNVQDNTTYWYNIKGYSSDGKVIKDYGEVKVEYVKKKPVIFKKFTPIMKKENVITYELAKESFVVLKVYDISGKLVRKIVEGKKYPGIHRIYWDGKDQRGKRLASGKYFYMLFADKNAIKQAFLFLK